MDRKRREGPSRAAYASLMAISQARENTDSQSRIPEDIFEVLTNDSPEELLDSLHGHLPDGLSQPHPRPRKGERRMAQEKEDVAGRTRQRSRRDCGRRRDTKAASHYSNITREKLPGNKQL